jgi:GNAT superfamily N-acetyltransferase
MNVEIREDSSASLPAYASIPIAFEVHEIFEVEVRQDGVSGLAHHPRPVARPYVKDYDVLDGGPLGWPQRFDLSKWVLLAAHVEGHRVGGAAVAFETPAEMAVLWDVRVAPGHRSRGVGSALVAAAEASASLRGYRQLQVETQNVNVPACRFYLRCGFTLGAIHRFAYPSLPEEAQLLWYKSFL